MEQETRYFDPDTSGALGPFPAVLEETGQGPPAFVRQGEALQRVRTDYATAIAVQKPRSISRITHNVLEEAKLAGAGFYYGWTVKTKRGPARIEGPSIDLAMCLARNYGNCAVDVEAAETPTHYMLKGIFIDLESGFTCPRLFRQRKNQSLGRKMEEDADRQEDIVFQIGQSKAIRNAIVRAMPGWLVEKAIETAKAAELKNINPENIHLARARVLQFFEAYGVTADRIEAKLGRNADEWSAKDIVELRGMATAIKEGRISAEELFPKQDDRSGPARVDPSLVALFDEAMGEDPLLAEFLEKTAKANGATVEQVKAEASVRIDSFRRAFEEWKRKEKRAESRDPKEKPVEDKKEDPFRAEYINLRSRGLSTWVYKNLDRIRNADEARLQEIRKKWAKIYPDNPFPLDRPRTDSGQGMPGAVFCPDKSSRIHLEVCRSRCDKADSCDSYKKAVTAPGGTSPSEEDASAKMISCPDLDGKERLAAECDECKYRVGCPSWD